jgi:hypothetical protein
MTAIRMETRVPRAGRMEHRWGHRIVCGTPARLSASGGTSGVGRLRDVSLSGGFVETALDLPLFARVTVFVRDTEVSGSVTRTDDDGVGIEWCDSEPRAICPLLGSPSPCAFSSECKVDPRNRP